MEQEIRIVSNACSRRASRATKQSPFPYGSVMDNLLLAAESLGFSNIEEALHALPISEEDYAKMGEEAIDRDMSMDTIRGLLHNELLGYIRLDPISIDVNKLFPVAGEKEGAIAILNAIRNYGAAIEEKGPELWVRHLDPTAVAGYPLEAYICNKLCAGKPYLPNWYLAIAPK